MSTADFSESALSLQPTPQDVADNHGYRERFEPDADFRESAPDGAAPATTAAGARTPEEIAKLISADAHQLIIDFEVGGRDAYDRKYCHPCRPPDPSGVTIGLGYDLGYYKAAEFEADWKGLISQEDLDRLRGGVGVKSGAAQDLLDSVKDIVVPWEAAETVYRKVTLPKFGGQTLRIFPGCDKLHPHCFGALLSLVYNRGASLSGDRRAEMRNIRDAIIAGTPEQVPDEFRAMKRIWPDIAGLRRRRDAEANLFARGLAEMERARQAASVAMAQAQVPPSPIPAGPGSPPPVQSPNGATATRPHLERLDLAEASIPIGEDGDLRFRPPTEYDETARMESRPLERQPEWTQVRWIEDDNLSTEYRHILDADRVALKEASFLFSAQDMDLLIRANNFEPLRTEKRIIFGLRGALLDHDVSTPDDRFAQVNRPSLRLKVTRPDHQNLRCVIGVYNLETNMLSGFIASTVPNRAIVYKYFEDQKAGNLLACGCYRYRVGPHHNGQYLGCLRQDGPAAVLRSGGNPVYDVLDDWDVQMDPPPMDNIHPAFGDNSGSSEFSSFGCQVIRGRRPDGEYTREFAKFRTALGLKAPGTDDNRLFSYILLTGQEAAIASRLRTDKRDTDLAAVRDSLVRIRQGSQGEPVRRLQAALKRKVDGIFSAYDKQALALLQRQRAPEAGGDGVYTPALDTAWGLGVFGEPAAAPTAPPPMIIASVGDTSVHRESVGHQADPALESVYYEIGRRAAFARKAPEHLTAAVLPHYETITAESWLAHVALGASIVSRIDRMAHALICGDQDSDAADRQKIQSTLAAAVDGGKQEFILAMSAILTGWLMVPPIVVTPIAEIVVSRMWGAISSEAGHAQQFKTETMCALWGGALYRAAVTPGTAGQRAPAPAAAGIPAVTPVPAAPAGLSQAAGRTL